jgi:hypothetical protein
MPNLTNVYPNNNNNNSNKAKTKPLYLYELADKNLSFERYYVISKCVTEQFEH